MLPYTQSLDGFWKLKRDYNNKGKAAHFELQPLEKAELISVPGSLATLEGNGDMEETMSSGTMELANEGGVFWYETTFTPKDFKEGMRGFLNFGAVEYYCDVFINGIYAGSHEGKQCEFDIEITKGLKAESENRVTVRVIFPKSKTIDGIDGKTLIGPGGGGGIYHSVNFYATGKTKIEFIQAYGNIHTGNIEINLKAQGEGSAEFIVSDNRDSLLRSILSYEDEIKPSYEIKIDNPLWWSVRTPNLYTVTVTLKDKNGLVSDRKVIRTGFREFKVNEKGEFTLNGKRIILKCAHGGCHTPYTLHHEEGMVSLNKWDIIAMKAAGFNCIRYLQSIVSKGTLELCDELGMMVYQEHGSSWIPLGFPAVSANENRQTREEIFRKFYLDVTQRVTQDINHPSVVLWGLLNETIYCQRYEAAKEALPVVRAIDKTRLILLSSGSWGADLNGSVCNPFEDKWSCLWGEEGTDFKSVQLFEDKAMRRYDVNETQKHIAGGYYSGSGDVHCYPTAQVTKGHFDWMENLGNGKKVFLSEFGVGSQFDYPGLARFMENRPRTPENKFNYELSHTNDKILKTFIKEYGLEVIYPTPRDLIRDSYAEQNKYREQVFSQVRANPNIVGYSMTAVQDHGYAGEGFLSLMGEFKPGHMLTMQEGWAPLRWCMLTYPTHFYNDEPVRLRAVLADEDVLSPGTYPATLRIYNENEIVWLKELTFTVPEGERPYTHNIFDETFVIEGLKEGSYTFCADLEYGALAQGGKVTFDVSKREYAPVNKKVCIAGFVNDYTIELLKKAGAQIVPFEEGDIILVGKLNDKALWDKVYARIEQGAKAVFAHHWSLIEKGENPGFLDEDYEAVNLRTQSGAKARLVSNWEWLYHRMPIAKPCSLLKGLKARGILDQNYYNEILSQQYLILEEKAKESAVLAFAMNVVATGGVGPICGTMLGKNSYGKGQYAFTTLDILENIGHPAADKLLLAMINAM